MAQKQDVYRNFQFTVIFDGETTPVAGFASINGLSAETAVIEYREGGDRLTPRKIMGLTTFDNITLERGKSKSTYIRDWANETFALNKGVYQKKQNDIVRNLTIRLHDRDFEIVARWRVECAWPTKFESGDLEADGEDVLMETVELAHEGMFEIRPGDTEEI